MKLSKFFLALSSILVVASIVLFFVPGPNLSMEFTGGTLMNVTIPAGKTKADLSTALGSFQASDGKSLRAVISTTREGTAIIRMRDITNEEHLALLAYLKKNVGNLEEQQFTTIGPSVGETLKQHAIYAILVASVGIILYLAFAFRRVPRSLSSWRFGACAVVAVIHDIIVTSGVFIIISRFTSFEFDTLFITALLTVLGYSVNDTIIIFDRIRENLSFAEKQETLAHTVEKSFRETFVRTLITTSATLITLTSLYIFGSESIRWFVLALIIGISFGTYSSYFVATPLLVLLRKKGR